MILQLDSKFTKDPETGCWLWQRVIDRNGYGRATYGAHRLIYAIERGDVPPELHLDHLCRTRHCVNPEHLEPVTPRENLLRGMAAAAQNARKTCCSNGHEFDMVVSGRRVCSRCKRAANAKRCRKKCCREA